jgi:hypothetical protein
MPQGLLQGNRRNITQPGILLFERRQQSCQIVIVQAPTFLEIGRLTGRKSPIVDKAATSERLSKYLLLLVCWVKPIPVGSLRLLAHGLVALSLFLDILFNGGQNLAIERTIMLFGYRSYLLQQLSRKPDGKRFDIVFHVAILTSNRLHVNGERTPVPKPQTRNGAYIPVAKARGFTRRFDNGVSSHRAHTIFSLSLQEASTSNTLMLVFS